MMDKVERIRNEHALLHEVFNREQDKEDCRICDLLFEIDRLLALNKKAKRLADTAEVVMKNMALVCDEEVMFEQAIADYRRKP